MIINVLTPFFGNSRFQVPEQPHYNKGTLFLTLLGINKGTLKIERAKKGTTQEPSQLHNYYPKPKYPIIGSFEPLGQTLNTQTPTPKPPNAKPTALSPKTLELEGTLRKTGCHVM